MGLDQGGRARAVTGGEAVGLHHPGLISGYDDGVGSEDGRVEADMNHLQEVAQGVFINGNIGILERQR